MTYGAQLLGRASSYVYDEGSKQWINASFQRIAELINDFDPQLKLAWNPEALVDGGQPYALMHVPLGQEPYIIMHLDEEDINEKLLGTIFEARSNAKNLNEVLAAQDAATRAVQLKEQQALWEEEKDKAMFLLRTPLNTIRLGNGKVLR